MQAPPISKREISKRWTPSLTVGGWTPLSNYFIENYHRLEPGLSHAEVIFIVHLMAHKWDEKAPFPSLHKISKRMGISSTALRNQVRKLERKGYIRREFRTAKTNMFHLDGLFQALERLQNASDGLARDFCPNCRTLSGRADRFCKHCGNRLGKPPEISVPPDKTVPEFRGVVFSA